MKSKTVFNILISFAIIFLLSAVMMIGYTIYVDGIVQNPAYVGAVGSHIENAYSSADPATMKLELLKAKQGMVDLKLTPDMYGRYWSWEKVPSTQMAWQYEHIDSTIVRIDEWQTWLNDQSSGNRTQQFNDVNSQKLKNLRDYIYGTNDGNYRTERVDVIAQDTYVTNYHTFVYVFAGWIVIILMVLASVFATLAAMVESNNRYANGTWKDEKTGDG